jgi:hypothetical protein
MYLKPTQSLWKEVESKISSMYEERLKYARDWSHYGMRMTEFNIRCLHSVIPPRIDELMQKLGEDWLPKNETITVRIANGGKDGDSYSFPANTGGRKPLVSAKWDYYNHNAAHVKDQEIIDIATKRREAILKITAEQTEFVASVSKVWNDAPSVNALMKIWPPIVDLLPAEVVQKLNEKNVRRTAAQMAGEVDTNKLSVHILKAKVAR